MLVYIASMKCGFSLEKSGIKLQLKTTVQVRVLDSLYNETLTSSCGYRNINSFTVLKPLLEIGYRPIPG